MHCYAGHWYRTSDVGVDGDMRRSSAKEARHYGCCDVAREQITRSLGFSDDQLTSPLQPRTSEGLRSPNPRAAILTAGFTRYSLDKIESVFFTCNRNHSRQPRHSPHPAQPLTPKPRSGARLSPHRRTRGKPAEQPTACGLLQASNPTPDIRRRELHRSQPVCRHLGPSSLL